MQYVATNKNGLSLSKKDVNLKILENQVIKIVRKPFAARSDRETMRIAEFFRYLNLFNNISSTEDIIYLAKKSTYQYFPTDSVVFHIGDPPLFYYVIVKGLVVGGPARNSTLVGKYFDEIETVFELGEGKGFGELAILKNDTRNMSIKAVKDSHMILIPRDDYKAVFFPIVARTIESNYSLLKDQKAFEDFSEPRLREFCSFLFEHNYRSDSYLSKQGETATRVFIIKSGKVDCYHHIYAEKLSERIKNKYKSLIEMIVFPVRVTMGEFGALKRKL